jgi:hypothetical protein
VILFEAVVIILPGTPQSAKQSQIAQPVPRFLVASSRGFDFLLKSEPKRAKLLSFQFILFPD